MAGIPGLGGAGLAAQAALVATKKRPMPPGGIKPPPRGGILDPPTGQPPWAGVYPPGSIQNYSSLIAADPGLIAYRGGETEALNNAATNRSAAIKALAIQHGGLPQGFQDKYGDLTPEIGDLASHNQFSDIAQLQRQRDAGRESLVDSLAARGALHSGALLGGLNSLNTDYGQQEYNAGNAFADKYHQAVQDYANELSGQKRGEAGAISTAAQNVYSNPANRSLASAALTPQPVIPQRRVLPPRSPMAGMVAARSL